MKIALVQSRLTQDLGHNQK